MDKKLLIAWSLLLISFTVYSQTATPKATEGGTWVIFIENSLYKTFASINGPSKDVDVMKKALSGYVIEKIIHKKNLTKAQMTAFFSVELKAIMKENKVNSVLLWYAGHGKLINETGYWIPVDAVRDDEKTYYSTATMKAAMIGYMKDIPHTLIVTDACDSGPSFYESMRDPMPEMTCEQGKLNSSQTFVSAGHDLAQDNSQFTVTFASTLSGNKESCIPIDKIVMKVSEAVVVKNKKLPKFAKISGFQESNGTFFFVKK